MKKTFFATMLLFSTACPLPIRESQDYYKIIAPLIAHRPLGRWTQQDFYYAIFDLSCCIARRTPLDSLSIPVLHHLGLTDDKGQASKMIRETCNIVSLTE